MAEQTGHRPSAVPGTKLGDRYRVAGPYRTASGRWQFRVYDRQTGHKRKMNLQAPTGCQACIELADRLLQEMTSDPSNPLMLPVCRPLGTQFIAEVRELRETLAKLTTSKVTTEEVATSPFFPEAWAEYVAHKVAEGEVRDGGRQLESDGRRLSEVFTARVSEIRQSDIDHWLTSLRKAGKSTGTRRKLLSYLRAFFRWAENRRGYCQEDPTKGFQVRRQETNPTIALSVEEARRLISSANSAHLRDALFIAFKTGLRKEKVLSLRWEQVDLEAGTIALFAEGTKKYHTDMTLPLNHELHRWLADRPRTDPIIRQRPGGNAWTTALKRAKLNEKKGIKFHSTRYSVKSWLTDAGVDPTIRDLLLGHRSNEVARLYEQPSLHTLKEAIDKLPVLL